MQQLTLLKTSQTLIQTSKQHDNYHILTKPILGTNFKTSISFGGGLEPYHGALPLRVVQAHGPPPLAGPSRRRECRSGRLAEFLGRRERGEGGEGTHWAEWARGFDQGSSKSG